MRKDTKIETSLIDRIGGAVKYAISGVTPNDWFSPNQPIAPVAQDQAIGRTFDYAVGQNLRITPRQGEGVGGVTYADLRALADNHDVTRLAIETKKDQLGRLKWDIKYKDENKENDSSLDAVKAFFKRPDKVHNHRQWLRMIIEDLLVIDATAIYPRKTMGGGVYCFDLLDAATINKMIDSSGKTPLAPSPAYQQILKGVPAVDYSTDELFYSNRNNRTNKIYGFSPVEQIIMTINMALRRQASQLEYFTSGTVPDAIMETPDGWTPDNIAQFQIYWDSILSGDTAERRKARFVPNGAKYTETKTQLLKDEFDEWIAKIISYAFSISSQALIKTMNRASAEVSVDTAEEEGLLPWKEHLKDLHDYIIENFLGRDDVEFVWVAEDSIDPKLQAEIDQIYITAGVYDAKFVQKRMGIESKEVEVAQPAITEKIAKADNTNDNNPVDEQSAILEVTLGKHLAEIAQQLAPLINDTNIETIDLVPYFEDFINSIEISDKEVMINAIKKEFDTLQITTKDMFNVANKEAEQWISNRGAELIGKKLIDGEFVTNPDSKWAITETTRDSLRREVTNMLEGNMTAKELQEAIISNHAFSQSRAKMIAITETNTAWNTGNLIAWDKSGVVEGKRSLLGNNEHHGTDDIENAREGEIPLNQAFKSGHMSPSYHPHCRCTLVPILKLKEK